MTSASSIDPVHSASLEKVFATDVDEPGVEDALKSGLGRIRDLVTLAKVDSSEEPHWSDRCWMRRIKVSLINGSDSTKQASFSLDLPWLCSEVAASSAPEDVQLGNHRGIFWERARYPVATYVYKPGIHYITRRSGSGISDQALLVSKFGQIWKMQLRRDILPVTKEEMSELAVDLLPVLTSKVLDIVAFREALKAHEVSMVSFPNRSKGDSTWNEEDNTSTNLRSRPEEIRFLGTDDDEIERLANLVKSSSDQVSPKSFVLLSLRNGFEFWKDRIADTIALKARGIRLGIAESVFDAVDILNFGAESKRLLDVINGFSGSGSKFQWTSEVLLEVVSNLFSIRENSKSAKRNPDSARAFANLVDANNTMDPSNWVIAGYGDQLLSEIARVTQSVARKIKFESLVSNRVNATRKKPISIEIIAARLKSGIQRAILDVATGRRKHSKSSLSRIPTNLLDEIESQRQRVFMGPNGLEDYEGRLDLRVLGVGWINELCPVQTPESKAIGLVRQLAIAEWGRQDRLLAEFREKWGADLSIAACLIPFVNHDDPTRIAIGAKMLKQAVILDSPEPPVVRTGAERVIGEAGVVRSATTGVVKVMSPSLGQAQIGDHTIRFGPPISRAARQAQQWKVFVNEGDVVAKDSILAHSPDITVDLETRNPQFSFGLNAKVAFLPWHGQNYEDGIVVSESFARRMTSTHELRLSEPLRENGEDWAIETLSENQFSVWHSAGTIVAKILSLNGDRATSELTIGERFQVIMHEDTDLSTRYLEFEQGEDGKLNAVVRVRVARPLQIGDKLTTRHGGKGVVTQVLPDYEMPRMSGEPVEVILNPLGVIRRLNIGTYVELHHGLRWFLREKEQSGQLPVYASRRLENRKELVEGLAKLGAPGGRVHLEDSSGKNVGSDAGTLAGILYLVKLDHLARDKAGARDDGWASPITFQPVRNSGWAKRGKKSSPQRLGEMEVWSLDALGAKRLSNDLFGYRGVGVPAQRRQSFGFSFLPAGLRAVIAQLSVAGVHVEAITPSQEVVNLTLEQTTPDPNSKLRFARGNKHGLIDIIDKFESRAKSVGKSQDVASNIIDFALADESTGKAARSAISNQMPRFVINLPISVQHPWYLPGMIGEIRLPQISYLPLLPKEVLEASNAFLWLGPRQRYVRIIQRVLDLRKLDSRSLEGNQRSRHGMDKSAGSSLARLDRLIEEERSYLVTKLEKEIHELLGDVDSVPASGNIAGFLNGKFGLLRRNLLGASAVRSGRAVLVGDINLDPEQVLVPSWMADAVGIEGNNFEEFDNVVLLNRQPTLHPYNLVALRAKCWGEDAIAINPVLLKSIAGDFDGDTVSIHRPVTEDARREAWELRRPAASIWHGASGEVLPKLDGDISIGYLISQPDAKSGSDVLTGFQSEVQQFVNIVRDSDTGRRALLRIVEFAKTCHESAIGWSPSIIDFPIGLGRNTEAEFELTTQLLDKDSWFRELALGVRAKALKVEDIALLFKSRGEVITPCNEIPVSFIKESYLEGLPTEEYFAAAQQGVAGIAAKKLVTPFGGALTRKLVREGYETIISRMDCDLGSDHTPLNCLQGGLCAAACGINPETRENYKLGTRIGLRAALFVGERGTQRALKSIHLRGENGLRATIANIDKLIHLKGKTLSNASLSRGKSVSYRKLIEATWNESKNLESVRLALRERFVELLGGEVSPIFFEVLLYRPWNRIIELLESKSASEPNIPVVLDRDEFNKCFIHLRSGISVAAWEGSVKPIVARLGSTRLAESLDGVEDEKVLIGTILNEQVALS